MPSNIPPRTHSTLSTIISTIRQSTAGMTSVNCIPNASNTNTIFLLISFAGQGADLLRQETADPSSDLRVIFQSACEYDITEMIRHLGISVHAIRAVGGAPATNLVIKQKFVDSMSDPITGNRLNCDKDLFCAISIRANSPQQASALLISLRGSLPNPHSYRHVHKLIAKVCRSKPSRLYSDLKVRTPYESPLFVSVHRVDEISQNPQQQPRWFADFFSVASHMIHPGEVDRFLVDKETAKSRVSRMYSKSGMLIQDNNSNNFTGTGGHYQQQQQQPLRLNYSYTRSTPSGNNYYQQQYNQHNNNNYSRRSYFDHQNDGDDDHENAQIVASDQDAMFVPSRHGGGGGSSANSYYNNKSSSNVTVENVSRAASAREPILLSRMPL